MNPHLFVIVCSLLIWLILAYALGLRFSLSRRMLFIGNDAWIEIDSYTDSIKLNQRFSLIGRAVFEDLRIESAEVGALSKTELERLARKDLIFSTAIGEMVLIIAAIFAAL